MSGLLSGLFSRLHYAQQPGLPIASLVSLNMETCIFHRDPRDKMFGRYPPNLSVGKPERAMDRK